MKRELVRCAKPDKDLGWVPTMCRDKCFFCFQLLRDPLQGFLQDGRRFSPPDHRFSLSLFLMTRVCFCRAETDRSGSQRKDGGEPLSMQHHSVVQWCPLDYFILALACLCAMHARMTFPQPFLLAPPSCRAYSPPFCNTADMHGFPPERFSLAQ